VECPSCGHTNPEVAAICQRCRFPLVADTDETRLRPGALDDRESPTELGPGPGEAVSGAASRDRAALATFQSFGNRFEILELLGEGGMGRVYKAWDRELEKVIALKTIRADHASNPEILRRFKQELLLARKITHKNVIRIHDLGEAEGVRFFTMDYVHGESLKQRIEKRGRIPVAEALPVIKQMLGALAEAHSQGVVHRDLKPQNIMIDTEGIPRIMDFGIARSVRDTSGMTATGALMGTPDYMSPEQARGEQADEQSDLFSFGVILYEMLAGELPYTGDTMVARVMARLSQSPRLLRETDPALPRFLESVVFKCLERDKELRYRSASEVLEDLERETVSASAVLRLRRAIAKRRPLVAATGVSLLALAAAGYFALTRKPPASRSELPTTTLAIVPFANASNDPSLDWLGSTLAEILTTEVGQSQRLRTVSGDRVAQILNDLRLQAGSRTDSATLARIAEFTGADTVVSGQFLKLGDQIRIDATVRDLARDRSVALKAEAASEAVLLATIRSLADDVRSNLGLGRDATRQVGSGALRPSSESLPALRFYGEGVQLSIQGRYVEALQRFEAALRVDPEFALAYAARGQTQASLGYDAQAEESLSTAIELGSGLPERERHLIAAIHARIHKDYDKAIEAYESLEKSAPEAPELKYRLAELYEIKGDYDHAQRLYDEVLARDPRSVSALLARGNLETNRGRPQQAFEPLNQALSLAIQLGNEEARGSALYSLGVAYRDLGKGDEALRYFRDALAARTVVGDKRGTAETLKELAKLDWAAGRAEAAVASNEKALALHREIGDREGEARVLMGLAGIHRRRGQFDEALRGFKDALQTLRELGDKRLESICLNSIGSTYVDQGDYGQAQTYLELALRLREELGDKPLMSETVHNLGELALLTGRYDRAIDHYLRALDLSREGADELGVAIESYSLGVGFGYQGRLGASVKAEEEAVRTLEKVGERGSWRAEVLGGYGNALNRVGRFEEASKALNEALRLARELEIPSLVAQSLNFIGEGFIYQGSPDAARSPLEESARVGQRQRDDRLALPAQVNLARLEAGKAGTQRAVERLESLTPRADALGLAYYSAECSIALAEALLRSSRHPEAEAVLDQALRKAARRGLRVQVAQIRYLMGERLHQDGSETEARRHYREAVRIIDDLRKEAGTDDILKRADLGSVYRDATSQLARSASR
jgi:eukaryotic-like serine/threonine-protein kinase